MRKNENQILCILSIGTVIALFFVIRECSYSLIWDTAIMRWIFIPETEEKLMSNIAYSYIAAYIFYLMQTYIPKIINKKNITPLLVPQILELNMKVGEFSFIVSQITYKQAEGLCINQENIPLYYKIIKDNKTHIKKVSDGNTLVKMLNRIEELYDRLFDKFVIYNLDVSILKLCEELPLEYYRQILEVVKLNENRRTPIIVNGVMQENTEILYRINKYFHVNPCFRFEKVNNEEIKGKYESAAKESELPDLDLALKLADYDD